MATADSSFRVKPKPKQGGLFQDPLEKDPLEKEARGAGTGGAKTKKTVNNISPDTSVASSAASISGSDASLSSSVPVPARPQYHIVSCSNRGVSQVPSLVRKPVPARPQPPTAPPPQQRGAGGRPVPVITPDTSQVMPVRGLFWREGPPDILSSAIISP